MNEVEIRRFAMRLKLEGKSISYICRSLKRSRFWFYKWHQRWLIGESDALYDVSRAPHHIANKTEPETERVIIHIRNQLIAHKSSETRYSLVGAPTIRQKLEAIRYKDIPSLRAIERVLQRSGLTGSASEVVTAPIVKECPMPTAHDSNEVHQVDTIGPRYLKGSKKPYYIFRYKDIFDCAVYAEVVEDRRTQTTANFLLNVWKNMGIPKILQMDNGMEFRGYNRWPRFLSKVVRLCLWLQVKPVFIPEGMPWYNGSVENSNGIVERLLIKAIDFKNIGRVRHCLKELLWTENHQHAHEKIGFKTSFEYRKSKQFRRIPFHFRMPEKSIPICAGKISFIRLVRRSGCITILKERFKVGKKYKNQFVKAVINTKELKLMVYHKGKPIRKWEYLLNL